MTRRPHGTGSMFQRKSDWRWIATVEDGWYASGARKRRTVTGKGCVGGCKPRCSHRTAMNRKLDKVKAAKTRGETASTRVTVKQWADTYLDLRIHDLSPKGYNAAASPIRKWVVPTIGHKRLADLTPGDLRAVAKAQRDAGRKGSTAAATHRAMLTMLRAAIRDGHPVPTRILETEAPRADKSDRAALTIPEGLAALEVASTLPHGIRWLMTLLYGIRKGEALGLTWDAIDFEAGAFGEAVIEWQLQSLPYKHGCGDDPCDQKQARSCPAREFRVPDGFEARHLVDAFHLIRPKTRQGYRVAPLLEPVRDGLLAWREVAPENPWGLVWPTTKGRPANDKHDLGEWHALQGTAGIGHPAGRPYHVHECRNFAATMLLDAGVDPHTVTALLGHSSIVTSLSYKTIRREPLLDALTRVGERLQLG